MKVLHSGDLKIAASCYTTTPSPLTYYFEETALAYTSTGLLTLSTNGQADLQLSAGESAIIRQFSEIKFTKRPAPGEQYIETFFFALPHSFLGKVLPQLQLPKAGFHSPRKLLKIASSPVVADHFRSIESYIATAEDMEEEVVQYKISNLLKFIADQNQALSAVFGPLYLGSESLATFMEANFRRKVTVTTLASENGVSLSSFNREFKRVFNSTPQRWITQRRLNEARVLLERSGRRPSQVYLEVGFQDLAHFSRAFKKQFGLSPTQVVPAN